MLVIILQYKTKKLGKQHRSFNQFGNMTRQSSAKLFFAPRETFSKDELVYLPALRINKTKHKNIDTLDMTENIAISTP